MMCCCEEPGLRDILAEPIIRALMQRDAVEESDLTGLLARVAQAWNGDGAREDGRGEGRRPS